MKKKLLVLTAVLLVLLTMTTVLCACNEKEFKVTVYDTDGVTVLETYTLKKGDSLSEKELTFSKAGYTFLGVYTDKEFTGEYVRGAVSSSFSLYARFSKDTYFITFINDGGEAVAKLEVKQGEKFELPTPAAREGYTFDGWTLDGELFTDDEVFSEGGSIRLRAKWTAKTTAVEFDLNGGTLLMAGASTFTYGQAVSLPVVQREGYNFIGWAKDGAEEKYNFATTWNVDTASVSFKAIWAAKSTKVTYDVNGGTFTTQLDTDENGNKYQNIAFDSAYTLPTAVKDGYSLVWVISGTNNELPNTGTWAESKQGLSLAAKWTANSYKLVFDAGEGTCATASIATKYGENFGILPIPTPPTGKVFDGWYYMNNGEKVFINANSTHDVANDITAIAQYANAEDTKYTVDVMLQNASDNEYTKIDTLEKRGETGATVDVATGVYTPLAYMTYNAGKSVASGEIAADGSLVLTLYYDRKSYTVTINENGGDNVADITARYGEIISAPSMTRTGYTFSQWSTDFPKTMPVDGAQMTAVWAANIYRLYLDVTLGDSFIAADSVNGVKFDIDNKPYIEVAYDSKGYNIPVITANGDYAFVSWKKVSDNSVFDATAQWKVTDNQSVYAVWSVAGGELFEVSGGNYFKESDGTEYVYVLVSDLTPNFGTGASYVANADGTMTITFANGRVRTVKYKTVEDVRTFERGEDYITSWVNRQADAFLGDSDTDVMTVGTANALIPDLNVLNAAGNSISTELANTIFTLSYKVGETVTAVPENLYSFANGELTFDGALLSGDYADKTFTMTASPKYFLGGTAPVASFSFTLNGGVNVYDNAEFKLAYENNRVKTVNVMRDITLTLTDDKYGYNGTNKYVKNAFDYCAFIRYAAEEETFTVNGNYFTIDGSSLPYFDNRYDGKSFMGEAAAINNVQSAIFGYSGKDKDGTNYPNAKIVINGMYLQGNNTKDAAYTEAKDSRGLDIYKMSGSFNGVRVENCGDLELNNTTIKNALIAIYTSAAGGQSTKVGDTYVISNEASLNYVLTDNSWANSVYCWGSANVNIANSKLLRSSGAAVHIEDGYDPNYTGSNTVSVDSATLIENYVTGEEAWFVAYGMNTIVPALKTQLDGAAQQMTNAYGNKKGIIKSINGKECFNFAIFSRSAGGESSDWATDKQGSVDMKTIYSGSELTLTNIATGTDATFTTDFKYIIFNTTNASVGEVFFFVSLETVAA